MSKVTFDYSKVSSFISDEEVVNMKKIAEDAKKVLLEKTGAGNGQIENLGGAPLGKRI